MEQKVENLVPKNTIEKMEILIKKIYGKLEALTTSRMAEQAEI